MKLFSLQTVVLCCCCWGGGDIMMLAMGALDSKAGVSSVSTWFDKINDD